MGQSEILQILQKHKGQKFSSAQIAAIQNTTKENANRSLAKLKKWKLIEYETIYKNSRYPAWVYWL